MAEKHLGLAHYPANLTTPTSVLPGPPTTSKATATKCGRATTSKDVVQILQMVVQVNSEQLVEQETVSIKKEKDESAPF